MDESSPGVVAVTKEHGLRVVYGDLFEVLADAICITTNGTVTERRSNVMGAGCAGEAARRWPWMPEFYGRLIERHGNHVYLVGPAVMFPVKHRVEEFADPVLIRQSCRELVTLADLYGWRAVALPTPGCGHGGLEWSTVGPMIAEVLDSRFFIVRFPSEYDAAEHSVAAGGIGRSTKEFAV